MPEYRKSCQKRAVRTDRRCCGFDSGSGYKIYGSGTSDVQPPFEIISGVFELRYLENRGAAFGMMQNRQYLFVVGASIVMVILIFLYHRMPYTKRYTPLRFCAVLLWAGAAGNAIDRLRLGYVIDFFYFKLIDFRFSMWQTAMLLSHASYLPS